MSIRITHGSATVELDAAHLIPNGGGISYPLYAPNDAMAALQKALRAIGSTQADALLRAIEDGLRAHGLAE